MNAGARNFLLTARDALEQLDQDGRAVLPVSAWPRVLQELGLQEDDNAAHFLMDHCQSNGQGFFTYVPLLQALRADQGDGGGGGGGGEGGEQGQGQGPGEPSDDRGMPPQHSDDRRRPPQNGDDRGASPQYAQDDRGMAPQQGYVQDDRGMPPQYGQDDRGRPPQYGQDDRGRPPQYYQDDRGRPPQYSSDDRGMSPPYGQEDRGGPQPPSLSARDPAGPAAGPGSPGGGGPGPLEQRQPSSPQRGGSGGPILPGQNSPSMTMLASDYGGESSFGEDEEAFWARRAAAIQRLYHLWDCNQLSNESFTVQLQNIMGDRAEITHPESEFVRLTNKHRNARNLKFAALMAALRRDAGSVAASRASSMAGGSQYGGSSQCPQGYAPSGYAASEAPSDAEALWNTPAGSPTGARVGEADPHYRRGRRHYADNCSSAGDSSAGWSRAGSEAGGGYPAGYQRPESIRGADGFRTLPPQQVGGRPAYGSGPIPEDEQFQEPRQYSSRPTAASPPGQDQGNYQDAPERPQGASGGSRGDDRDAQRADAAYWAQALPNRGVQPPSEAGTDLNSLADSQRTGYTLRGRGGHGNILTWGDDSRAITPERKRRGKQLAVDEQSGTSRSHMPSNIFAGPGGDQRR